MVGQVVKSQLVCDDFRNRESFAYSARVLIGDPIYSDYASYLYLAQLADYVENIFLFINSLHLLPCVAYAVRQGDTRLASARVLTVHKQTHGALSGSSIEKAYHALWMGTKKTISNKHKIPDSWISNTWDSRFPTTHKWTKNPEYIALLIQATTIPGDVIFDPCSGHALVPYMAKELGRNYLAAEKDPKTYQTAQTILATAQAQALTQGEQNDHSNKTQTRLFG